MNISNIFTQLYLNTPVHADLWLTERKSVLHKRKRRLESVFFYRTTDRWGCVAGLIIDKMFFSCLKVNGIGLALKIPIVRCPHHVSNLIIVAPWQQYGWMELIPLVIFMSIFISWYYGEATNCWYINLLMCKTFTNRWWFYILSTIMVTRTHSICVVIHNAQDGILDKLTIMQHAFWHWSWFHFRGQPRTKTSYSLWKISLGGFLLWLAGAYGGYMVSIILCSFWK